MNEDDSTETMWSCESDGEATTMGSEPPSPCMWMMTSQEQPLTLSPNEIVESFETASNSRARDPENDGMPVNMSLDAEAGVSGHINSEKDPVGAEDKPETLIEISTRIPPVLNQPENVAQVHSFMTLADSSKNFVSTFDDMRRWSSPGNSENRIEKGSHDIQEANYARLWTPQSGTCGQSPNPHLQDNTTELHQLNEKGMVNRVTERPYSKSTSRLKIKRNEDDSGGLPQQELLRSPSMATVSHQRELLLSPASQLDVLSQISALGDTQSRQTLTTAPQQHAWASLFHNRKKEIPDPTSKDDQPTQATKITCQNEQRQLKKQKKSLVPPMNLEADFQDWETCSEDLFEGALDHKTDEWVYEDISDSDFE